jgi:phosphoribosylformylglycinamidine synthase
VKALVHVTLKKDVLDPQGKAIARACGSLGFGQLANVRQGKLFELELAAGLDRAQAEALVREVAEKLLANPVIEDFRIVSIEG